MSERYQIHDAASPLASEELAQFRAKDGQLLPPMLDLIEQAQWRSMRSWMSWDGPRLKPFCR